MATKKCSYCAEEIQEKAVVCKHCGRDLLEKKPPEEKEKKYPKVAKILQSVTSTPVLLALITVLLGPTLASNVSKEINDKNLHFQAMSALMDYTQEADLEDLQQVAKLESFILLVKSNDKTLDLGPFEAVVHGFSERADEQIRKEADELKENKEEKDEELKTAQAQIRELQAKLNSGVSSAEKTQLQQQLVARQQHVTTIEMQRNALSSELEKVQRALTDSEALSTIRELALQQRVAEQTKALRAAREDTRRLQSEVINAHRYHKLTFELSTSDGLGGRTDDEITVAFSNNSFASQSTHPENLSSLFLRKFTFPGELLEKGSSYVFERVVDNGAFLENAKYIVVFNAGTDGWAGKSIKIIHDESVFLEESLTPRNGYQELGGIEFFNEEDWVKRKFWEKELPKISE